MPLGFITKKQIVLSVAGAAAILVTGGLFAFQPLTRNYAAGDGVCLYCHIDSQYTPTLLTSSGKPHPRSPEGPAAQCVDCHLPTGFWETTNAYLHFASFTDLFGHLRDRDAERAGDWIPPLAATAHRVRERLLEYDSSTCRNCHVEAEIQPKSSRGQLAHDKALRLHQTCIECHYNMAHRLVELRDGTFPVRDEDEAAAEAAMPATDFNLARPPDDGT